MSVLPCACGVQIEESDEARRKFAGAKAISSQQYFERDNKELQAQNAVKLQQFQVGRQAHDDAGPHCRLLGW